jgi:uncharacterized protein (TIGR03067 family)
MKTLTLMLLILPRTAQGPTENPKVAELTKLQGLWPARSSVANGVASDRPMPFDVLIDGEKLSWVSVKDGHRAGTFRIEVDPAKSPKQIDLIPEFGQMKGKRQPGIYKIDGERLELCFATREGKPRPEAFESKKDSGVLYLICLRPTR